MAWIQAKEPKDEEQMVKATQVVREKMTGSLKAAKIFKVLRTTLQRLSQITDLTSEEAVATLGMKTILCTQQLEKKILEYVLTMESKFHRLTKRNNLRNSFRESDIAGKTCFKTIIVTTQTVSKEAYKNDNCKSIWV